MTHTIQIGAQIIDASRYRKMKRTPAGGVKIYLDNPRDIVLVEDAQQADLAVAEVQAVMGEIQREAMGGGWVTMGGWGDDDE